MTFYRNPYILRAKNWKSGPPIFLAPTPSFVRLPLNKCQKESYMIINMPTPTCNSNHNFDRPSYSGVIQNNSTKERPPPNQSKIQRIDNSETKNKINTHWENKKH